MDGTGARAHPFVKKAIRKGQHCMLFQYYMDGLTLTNPLGAANVRHKLAVSYVAVLNFSPSHRTSPHSIIPVSICMEKEYSRYDPSLIVCGPEDEPVHGTSFGAQMRRLRNGMHLSIPARFARHPAVQNTSEGGCQIFVCTGGLVLVSADTPAAATLFGKKIAVGPSTVSICRLCYCKQVCYSFLHSKLFESSVNCLLSNQTV